MLHIIPFSVAIVQHTRVEKHFFMVKNFNHIEEIWYYMITS